ncbi:MAG: hypothetical protein ACRD4P_17215 [Bryobacteraceae bacterium]
MTIDWPCALGDWLWANLVVAPTMFLDWLTFRRAARIILQIALVVAFFLFFEQIAALHLASLFAVDANAYLDLFVAIFLLVSRGQIPHMLQLARRRSWRSLQNCSNVLQRFGARQRRNARAAPRKEGAGDAKQSDDEPAASGGTAYAFA